MLPDFFTQMSDDQHDIVDEADDEHHRSAHDERGILDVLHDIEVGDAPAEKRHAQEHREATGKEAQVQRDSAAPRHRMVVHTAVAGVIDGADGGGKPAAEGNRRERDEESHRKDDDSLHDFGR